MPRKRSDRRPDRKKRLDSSVSPCPIGGAAPSLRENPNVPEVVDLWIGHGLAADFDDIETVGPWFLRKRFHVGTKGSEQCLSFLFGQTAVSGHQ